MSANDELQAHTCEKMLEFYGDVANNIAQGKVQDSKTNYEILKEYEAHKTPIPSYKEWLGTKVLKEIRGKGLSILQEGNNELAKENQHLKTLLREWMHFYPIILYEHEDTLKTKDIVELFDKTREVLK